MPAEVPERVAVVETQQQHIADELREVKREMVLVRQQLDEFVRDALPVIKAVREQQQAKAKAWNAIAMKFTEVSIVAILGWIARGVYLQATQDVAHQVETRRDEGK